ncbi:hypothetical protein GCM10025776_15930 [Corallincola platygyrae]
MGPSMRIWEVTGEDAVGCCGACFAESQPTTSANEHSSNVRMRMDVKALEQSVG